MRALLVTVFGGALLLPPLLVGSCAWLWQSNLAHPWLFATLGLFLLYATAAYLLVRQFRDIGITGQRSSDGGIRTDRLLRQEAVSSLLIFLLVSAGSLASLRYVLAK